MGVRIMRKGKSHRRWWYGEYRENGKLKRVKLPVRVVGEPPPSYSAYDQGDVRFEISKAKAQSALEDLMASRQQKGMLKDL